MVNHLGERIFTRKVMSKSYFGIDIENLPASLKILHLQPEFGIFLIQNEKIIYANKRFQELFDVTEEELTHFDIFKLRDQIVHTSDMEIVKQHYGEQIKVKSESAPSKYEYRIVTKKKETRWISFYLINIEYEKNPGILMRKTFSYTESHRDLTESHRGLTK